MKTAISIPDDKFQAAEKLAARLGITRSELYQRAIMEFVDKHAEQKVTEKLNEIYQEGTTISIDESLVKMQLKSLFSETW